MTTLCFSRTLHSYVYIFKDILNIAVGNDNEGILRQVIKFQDPSEGHMHRDGIVFGRNDEG